MKTIKEKLAKAGISTMKDIDKMRYDKKSVFYCKSRFDILKTVVGFNAAAVIMNELSIKKCCQQPRS